MILPAAHLVSAKQIGRTVMCALCGVLGGPAHWTDESSTFVLSTTTSKTEIVDNLAHLWMAAERLLGRSCDPLDEELIALMERELG